MKLFKFYPNEFCRMYVVGKDIPNILQRREELFLKFIEEECPWIDSAESDDMEYIETRRADFDKGLYKIVEVQDGMAIDSHY